MFVPLAADTAMIVAPENARQGAVLFALGFDLRGAAHPIDPLAIEQGGDFAFYWLHLNLADARSRDALARVRDFPPAVIRAMLQPGDHQHFDHEDACLWGIFPDIGEGIDGAQDSLEHLRFAVTSRGLITGRRHAVHSIESMRRALGAGSLMDSPFALFEALSDQIGDGLAQSIAGQASALDEVEDRIIAGYTGVDARTLAHIRRAAVRLERALANAHSILRRFELRRPAERTAEMTGTAERTGHRFGALHHEAHVMLERVRMLQDEVQSQIQSSTNANLFTLTIINSLLFPATLVTGFFGMNLKNLPIVDHPHGTLIVIGICLVSSALTYWYMRRRGALA